MQSPRDEHSLTSVAGAQRVRERLRPALPQAVGTRRALDGDDGVGGCNMVRSAVSKSLFWSLQWTACLAGGPEWIQEAWEGPDAC